MGLGDPDFGKTAEFIDMSGTRQNAEPVKTGWTAPKITWMNGWFDIKILQMLGASEVHHLIADLQTALQKYAMAEIISCGWCNPNITGGNEMEHTFASKEPS